MIEPVAQLRERLAPTHEILPVEVILLLIDAANRAYEPAFGGSRKAVNKAYDAARAAENVLRRSGKWPMPKTKPVVLTPAQRQMVAEADEHLHEVNKQIMRGVLYPMVCRPLFPLGHDVTDEVFDAVWEHEVGVSQRVLDGAMEALRTLGIAGAPPEAETRAFHQKSRALIGEALRGALLGMERAATYQEHQAFQAEHPGEVFAPPYRMQLLLGGIPGSQAAPMLIIGLTQPQGDVYVKVDNAPTYVP